jgi:hypothetical protein
MNLSIFIRALQVEGRTIVRVIVTIAVFLIHLNRPAANLLVEIPK